MGRGSPSATEKSEGSNLQPARPVFELFVHASTACAVARTARTTAPYSRDLVTCGNAWKACQMASAQRFGGNFRLPLTVKFPVPNKETSKVRRLRGRPVNSGFRNMPTREWTKMYCSIELHLGSSIAEPRILARAAKSNVGICPAAYLPLVRLSFLILLTVGSKRRFATRDNSTD